ncbi:hypothetical protein TrCOL_g951 [Triparma columacea]|uniref:Uncharacterized protein n=1 Tax=Triparma columacea TaxID=722753 RepID=A0A9W7L8B1_9STRA|nr:hypothetical protein TrCOL_g951 [Triparma columacea]
MASFTSPLTDVDLPCVNAQSSDSHLHTVSLSTTAVAETVFNLLLNEVISYVQSLPSTPTSESQASLIESIGYSVGLHFWSSVFGHQITKLQTNHRGVFVLKDESFPLLSPLSAPLPPSSRLLAILTLAYPCGLIRGALKGFGRESVVSCDFLNDGENVESTSFNVKILM